MLPAYGENAVARVVGFPLTSEDEAIERWGSGATG